MRGFGPLLGVENFEKPSQEIWRHGGHPIAFRAHFGRIRKRISRSFSCISPFSQIRNIYRRQNKTKSAPSERFQFPLGPHHFLLNSHPKNRPAPNFTSESQNHSKSSVISILSPQNQQKSPLNLMISWSFYYFTVPQAGRPPGRRAHWI